MAQTLATHAYSRDLHGAIGADFMSQCSRMTLNFVARSFILS